MVFVKFRGTTRMIQNVANLNNSNKLVNGNYCSDTRRVITSMIRYVTTSTKLKAKERKFSKYHTWILAEDRKGIVGLSHYAQKKLDEFVYVELPNIGKECKMNEPCGTLESVRAVIDLCSPVSGVVYEKSTVEDFPRLINESCYDKGWLYKLKLSQLDELKMLMNEAEYEDFVKKNFGK